MRAYHFLRDNMKAGSGREKAWTIGETRTKKRAKLCESGYHSSLSWRGALRYAPGAMACIVDVSDPVQQDADKQVSFTRTLLSARDATRVLHLFACECAERALKAANITDNRSWNAIAAKRLWLDGKATDAELAGARDGARAAARDGAWAAARDVAWDAARDAEEAWQRKRLNEMMAELFEEGE